MSKSLIFLADGFEEIEALATLDIMRRGGMDVETVSIMASAEVCGAHGVTVKADMMLADAPIDDAEWLILPGGLPGATNLADNEAVCAALKRQYDRDGKIAAICASPAVVLYPLGLLDGVAATCYPSCEQGLDRTDWQCAKRVVKTGNIITGNGPSSAIPFGLAIVAESKGEDIARQVGQGSLYYA